MGRRRTHEQTAAQLLQYRPMKPEAPTPANALTVHTPMMQQCFSAMRISGNSRDLH